MVNYLNFLFIILAGLSSTSIETKPTQELLVASDFLFFSSPDPKALFYDRVANAMFQAFKADFGAALPGYEYIWNEFDSDCYEYGLDENQRLIYFWDYHDENGFYAVGVICIVNGWDYCHRVKSCFILKPEQEKKMKREIRWAIFSLFSMSEDGRKEFSPYCLPYTIDKDPPVMLK